MRQFCNTDMLYGRNAIHFFVRNPWDRLVSIYCQLKKVLSGIKTIVEPSFWVLSVLSFYKERSYLDSNDEMVGFSKFVKVYQPMPWEPTLKTQAYILQMASRSTNINFIGRFENIKKNFHCICKKIKAKK